MTPLTLPALQRDATVHYGPTAIDGDDSARKLITTSITHFQVLDHGTLPGRAPACLPHHFTVSDKWTKCPANRDIVDNWYPATAGYRYQPPKKIA